jgi:hypothetical protein
MTARAYIIGCPALGLQEAIADAAVSAQRLQQIGWSLAGCNVAPLVDKAGWLDVRDKLSGADKAMIYYSGHGYAGKVDGKIETGLYSGTCISHAWLMAKVIVPLRATTKYLIRVYDSCYAGGTLGGRALGTSGTTPGTYKQRVKCTLLTAGAQEPGVNEHYKPIDAGDVVFAACSARQYSYGSFDGGETEVWHPLNTCGRSLFTQCFWSAVMACDYAPGRSLNEINIATQWRCENGLKSFAKHAGWLTIEPGVKWPIPNVMLRKGKGVPDNILIAT